MTQLSFDLRDILRGLRRDRAYTSTVVLTLALTIGASTAVFSIVDGVLLKPLAYGESHRLVSVKEIWRQLAQRMGARPGMEVNAQHFEYWRTRSRTFESMAQYIVRPQTSPVAAKLRRFRSAARAHRCSAARVRPPSAARS
jgi:hypothetical protein